MNCYKWITSVVLMFAVASFSNAAEQKGSSNSANIFCIESLADVSIAHPQKTLFLFDVDDTLLDFPYMLGSKAWRQYIREATKQWDSKKNWHDILSLFLTQKHPVRTVESTTRELINELQSRGYVVCGLTSRERNMWYETPQDHVDVMTTNQLYSVGIYFDDACLKQAYPHLADAPEYFQGTFFADCDTKGDYLLKLLKSMTDLPEKVIFIDDKMSQSKSVATALARLGVSHESYCYTYTDAKARTFDPLLANIQLYHFFISEGQRIVSDEEAACIALENPTKDADDYLKAVLEIADGRQ